MASDYSRPKIIEFLIDRIVRNFKDLNLEERTSFVEMLRNIEDETVAYTGNVLFQTGIESVLKTIEPYIVEDIAVMDI